MLSVWVIAANRLLNIDFKNLVGNASRQHVEELRLVVISWTVLSATNTKWLNSSCLAGCVLVICTVESMVFWMFWTLSLKKTANSQILNIRTWGIFNAYHVLEQCTCAIAGSAGGVGTRDRLKKKKKKNLKSSDKATLTTHPHPLGFLVF